ncbi:J domain-containing protein [Lysobacter auxotrophicus]|uniref:J domain-containing protein n=1 Tax=Lysobacter auxotrophicus TaxID=2992573 RepID=A0ABN6UIE9_9GAMM|nr:J domain-containing protein [Lysobacter auxotrophicus]BDU16072.1 J domain-containing protein [Lysobacter auxotrophicus]
MSQDFALLYMQLGLHPDCSLEDLKRAYRVRVAELHPDRHLDRPSSDEANSALTELTALYSGAIRFHRIHGRLPGSTPRGPAMNSRPMPDASHAPSAAAGSRHLPASERTTQSVTPRIAVLSVLVLVVVMVVLHWSETAQVAPHAEHEAAVAAADPNAPRLELGMEEAAVVAIQGAPERVQDDVWNYGSSWVRFEEGHVVDWASVPPNRLMTLTPRPVKEDEDGEEEAFGP